MTTGLFSYVFLGLRFDTIDLCLEFTCSQASPPRDTINAISFIYSLLNTFFFYNMNIHTICDTLIFFLLLYRIVRNIYLEAAKSTYKMNLIPYVLIFCLSCTWITNSDKCKYLKKLTNFLCIVFLVIVFYSQ